MWIFGSPRSGSTWLLNLLMSDPRVVGLDEPGIGAHLGVFMTGLFGLRPQLVDADFLRLNEARADAPSYLFSRRYERVWGPLVHDLVLGRVNAEIDHIARERGIADPIAAIKEPNGSQGADVVMAALPGARMIWLLRDGRDVVDSELDAGSAGAWADDKLPGYAPADSDRLAFVRERAHVWLCRTHVTQRAYEAHDPELRLMVRYEELLSDTPAHLRAIVDWIGLDMDDTALREIVDTLAFDRVDSESRGAGRFARAATPGLWRENLDAEEQAVLGEVIGSKLRELGYE